MISELQLLKFIRTALYNSLSDLDPDQWLAMPEGFDNNIAWNVGHIVAVQQNLVYGRSGLPMAISEEMAAPYLPGTSPTDWIEEPDVAELLALMMDYQQTMEEDYAAGKFTGIDIEPFTIGSSLEIIDMEGVLAFNVFHEGLHTGAIQALKNLV